MAEARLLHHSPREHSNHEHVSGNKMWVPKTLGTLVRRHALTLIVSIGAPSAELYHVHLFQGSGFEFGVEGLGVRLRVEG